MRVDSSYIVSIDKIMGGDQVIRDAIVDLAKGECRFGCSSHERRDNARPFANGQRGQWRGVDSLFRKQFQFLRENGGKAVLLPQLCNGSDPFMRELEELAPMEAKWVGVEQHQMEVVEAAGFVFESEGW